MGLLFCSALLHLGKSGTAPPALSCKLEELARLGGCEDEQRGASHTSSLQCLTIFNCEDVLGTLLASRLESGFLNCTI